MRNELQPLGVNRFKVLMEVSKQIDENGFPPSIREIGEAVGITSTSAVSYNINKLVEAGYLEKRYNVSRGLRVKVDPSLAPLDFDPNEVFTEEPQVSEE